jgi:hypothetical protein
MYFGYTISELIIFCIAGLVALWSLVNIITGEKHASKFLYWFILAATGFGLWMWRSGSGVAFYHGVKSFIGTP